MTGLAWWRLLIQRISRTRTRCRCCQGTWHIRSTDSAHSRQPSGQEIASTNGTSPWRHPPDLDRANFHSPLRRTYDTRECEAACERIADSTSNVPGYESWLGRRHGLRPQPGGLDALGRTGSTSPGVLGRSPQAVRLLRVLSRLRQGASFSFCFFLRLVIQIPVLAQRRWPIVSV